MHGLLYAMMSKNLYNPPIQLTLWTHAWRNAIDSPMISNLMSLALRYRKTVSEKHSAAARGGNLPLRCILSIGTNRYSIEEWLPAALSTEGGAEVVAPTLISVSLILGRARGHIGDEGFGCGSRFSGELLV